MARKRTGQVRSRNGKWYARITLNGKQRPSYELPTCKDETAARTRAGVLADIAAVLRDAGQLDLAPRLLEKAACSSETCSGKSTNLS